MSTTVASKNPFELLGDDDGGAPAAAPAKTGANKAAEPKKAGGGGGGDAAKKGGPASRSGRYPGRGGPARTAPRAENVNEDASDAPKRFDGEKARRGGTRGRGGEGGGRGGGRGYGGRGGGRGGPRGDRPDRHSATGIVDSEKKLHQGWGGDTGDGEQLAEAQGEADAKAAANDWSAGGGAADTSAWDTPAAGGDAPAAAGGDGAAGEDGDAPGKKYRERRQREEEEDEGLQTLEEYRKTQTTGLEELVPKLEVRTANDGANDKSLFKGATKLIKDEEASNYFVGKGKSGPRVRAQKEAKQIIEIDGRFDRPNRGGEGRGRGGDFRGRGRGGEGRGGYENRGGYEGRGRGRGAPRGGGAGRPAQSQEVNVEDTSAFPSLSSS